jgi:hypothetical protein
MAATAVFKKLHSLAKSQSATAEMLINSKPIAQVGTTWSPHKILQHIANSQAGTIKVMAWKKEKGDYKDIPLSHKFNFLMLRLFFKFNLKTKAPNVLPEPTEEVSLSELKDQLEEQHKALEIAIGELSKEHIKKAVFRHPFTGLMDASMTVQFLRLHWEHHRKQIINRMQ